MEMIALGYRAKDKVTGLEGLIVCKTENYGSATRWSLQLSKIGENDKEYPHCYDIDQVQLELTSGVRVIDPVLPDPTSNTVVSLGEEAEDTITGFKGIVTSKCTFLNGCIFYRLETKPTKEKMNEVVAQAFPAIRIRRLGRGVVSRAPQTAKTGGPVTVSMKVAR